MSTALTKETLCKGKIRKCCRPKRRQQRKDSVINSRFTSYVNPEGLLNVLLFFFSSSPFTRIVEFFEQVTRATLFCEIGSHCRLCLQLAIP